MIRLRELCYSLPMTKIISEDKYGWPIEESLKSYKEIEFVCVNRGFSTATPKRKQDVLFKLLKKIEGVLPYRQDFGFGEVSLAAILLDPSKRDAVIDAAKLAGVEIDLEQDVSERTVDEILRGTYDYLVIEDTTSRSL
jgi:hypothetical protein